MQFLMLISTTLLCKTTKHAKKLPFNNHYTLISTSVAEMNTSKANSQLKSCLQVPKINIKLFSCLKGKSHLCYMEANLAVLITKCLQAYSTCWLLWHFGIVPRVVLNPYLAVAKIKINKMKF